MPGRWIVVVSWVTLGLFVVTIVPDAAGLSALDGLGVGVVLGLFLISLPVWCYAFGLAVVRSSRGEDVGVGGLFFLVGSAPADVRRWLFGALAISVVVAFGAAFHNAFAILEPMMPLGLIGLWSARYGTFPARRDMPGAVRKPASASRPRLQHGDHS